MQSNAIKMSTFMSIEDSEEVLQFRFDHVDFLMWPLVRYAIFATLYYRGTNVRPFIRNKIGFVNLGSYLLRAYHERPFRKRGMFDLLYFNSGVTNILKGNSYFNRITDHFAGLFPTTSLLVEDSVEFQFRRPRTFPNVSAHDGMLIIPKLLAKFTSPKKRERHAIDSFISFLESKFGKSLFPEEYRTIARILDSQSIMLPHLRRSYEVLFKKFKPKIVFVEDASYGQRSFILKWASDLGIATAELQHGYISDDHAAYNYGKSVLNSKEYQKYLPNYFLGYGQFWLDQINLPVKKVVIGNPMFAESLRELRVAEHASSKKVLLILSNGCNPTGICGFTSKLLESGFFKDFEVIFRPHPAERKDSLEIYADILRLKNVRIDANDSIYSSFAKASVIVSELSTAVYEAAGFCNRIFVINDKYSASHVPEKLAFNVETVEDVLRILENTDIKDIESDFREKIWAPNWENNFKTFICEIF
jgi:hypothetical protein